MRDVTILAIALIIASIFVAALLTPQYFQSWGPAGLNMGMVGGEMMAPGMAGSWMRGSGTMGYYSRVPSPLPHEKAKAIVKNYLASLNNPDLAIDEFEEYSNNFYVSLVEKSTGRGAFEILIDRYKGTLWPEPQSIMWNTKYRLMGMMSGYPTDSAQGRETLDQKQALKISQDFLKVAFLGAEAGEVVHYYGYFTIMVALNVEHYGMLSINEYTGAIWYHAWHGMFISEVEN